MNQEKALVLQLSQTLGQMILYVNTFTVECTLLRRGVGRYARCNFSVFTVLSNNTAVMLLSLSAKKFSYTSYWL